MEEGLKLVISADGSEAVRAFSDVNDAGDKMAKGFSGSANAVSASIEQMKGQIEKFRAALKLATDPKDQAILTQGITKLNSEIRKLERADNPLKGFHVGVLQSERALNSFDGVLRNVTEGTGNFGQSITSVLENFLRLRTETGGTGKAIEMLTHEFLSGGGLILAIGLAIPLIEFLGEKFFGLGEKSKKSAHEIKGAGDVLSATSSEYKEAFTNVNKLREEIDLAKNGFINKTTVVNEYNKTIGETIGKVKTLDEVEKAIAEKGDAYIKFTLLKAAANKALEKSADEALKATVKQTELVKPLDTKSGLFKGVDKNLNPEDAARLKQGLGQAFDGVNKKITEEVNKTKGESQRFEDIAKDFFKQAAELSSKFNFKFDGGKFDDKTKGTKEKPKFDFLFDFLPFDPNGNMKPEQKGELLNAIDKFSKEFSGILKGVNFVGNADQRIEQARKFDLKLKAGKIEFDTKALTDSFKKVKAEDILPPDELNGLSTQVVDQFSRGMEDAFKTQIGNQGILPSKELLDTLNKEKERFAKAGFQFPEIDITKIIDPKKLQETLDKAFDTIKSKVDLINNTLEPAFESMFSTFENGGNAIKAFADQLGQAVKKLIAQLLAEAAVAAIVSALVPGAGNFLSVFKGLTGLKFAKGGFVPGSGSGDTVPAMLTPGEYVVTKDKAPLAAALFEGGFKGGKLPFHFATGGLVPQPTQSNYQLQAITVNVSGELRGHGNSIVAVIDQTLKAQRRAF